MMLVRFRSAAPRPTFRLFFLATLLATVFAPPVLAEDEDGPKVGDRAVDVVNARFGFQYDFLRSLAVSTTGQDGFLDLERNRGQGVVSVTAPITDLVGVRGTFAGGVGNEGLSNPQRQGDPKRQHHFESTLESFVRDPHYGEFLVGYQYSWEDQRRRNAQRHSAIVRGTAYAHEIVDVGLLFMYSDLGVRESGVGTGSYSTKSSADEYMLRGFMNFYPIDWFSFGGGLEWQSVRTERPGNSDTSESSEAIGFTLGGEVLLGPEGSRFVSLNADGGFAFRQNNVAGSEDDSWTAGVGITVYTHRVPSLRHLNRERR